MSERISLGTSNGVNVITAETDGRMYCDRVKVADYELFTPVFVDANGNKLPPGECALLAYTTNRYLSALSAEECEARGVAIWSVMATAEYVDLWERFRFTKHGRGLAFQSVFTNLYLSPQNGGGSTLLCNGPAPAEWEELHPSDMGAFGGVSPPKPPVGTGVVRLIDGYLRQQGHSVADNSGPRLAYGCSDFVAMAKFNEDRDTYFRNLDITAQWQQFTRIGWRCNGWEPWVERGLTVDPYQHPWWETALRGVLQAHRDRGLKVKLSSFDMNHWSDSQAMETFQRVAGIAREYGDTVWASAVTNEIAGTWEPGETDENIARGHELMDAYIRIYPGGLHTISDPAGRDKTGMQKLAKTLALIHQNGASIDDLIRRTFNDLYENYPGVPVDSDEPRGPNGPQGGYVTASVEDPNELFALYTTQILVGEIATYFNSPGAAERRPLDDTWGFKELPHLWKTLGVPENIGQGQLGAGHTGDGMMLVNDSHASRADGVTIGAYNLGTISGQWDGQTWAVRANKGGEWSTWYADGKAWEGRLSHGQVIPTPRGFTPAVVRCIT